jgi:tRNA dimethylallyltransferase
MTRFVAIVGPTASGKSDLAVRLAEAFDGEIVCADSRTIYRGMSIGTAKPSAADRNRVRHHLLDFVDPGETLSAGRFRSLADAAIEDIAGRDKLPLLVGGSGLYINGVVYRYDFAPPADTQVRAALQDLSTDELIHRLVALDSDLAASIDRHNRRRIIRALETYGAPRSRQQTASHVLLLGLDVDKKVAQERISQRVESMLGKGFIEEVKMIGETYGWDSPAFEVIGYRAFKDVALGTKSIADGVQDFVSGDTALYKKQMTWFKRDPHIVWIPDPAEAFDLVRAWLDGHHGKV